MPGGACAYLKRTMSDVQQFVTPVTLLGRSMGRTPLLPWRPPRTRELERRMDAMEPPFLERYGYTWTQHPDGCIMGHDGRERMRPSWTSKT